MVRFKSSLCDWQILVELANNPTQGSLRPSTNLFMPVVDGVANFTLLNIDRAGEEYRLAFTL
jgi:hypothetical protein